MSLYQRMAGPATKVSDVIVLVYGRVCHTGFWGAGHISEELAYGRAWHTNVWAAGRMS